MSDANAKDPGAPLENAPPAPPGPESGDQPSPASPPSESLPTGASNEPHEPSAPGPVSRESLVEHPARRRDKTVGTVIVVVAFLLSLGISLWAKHASRPEVSDPPKPATTEGVVGFPSAVDAIAMLPAARGLTKRPMLRKIAIEGVAQDGTVDVKSGSKGRVRYTFQSPPGHGPQPPREPGTLPRQLYCGKQTVQIKKTGLAADADKAGTPCSSNQGEPLPDPQCQVRDLWQFAIKQGAPSDRLAEIEYYRSKAGPAWRFAVPGTKHRFAIYGDCQRLLVGAEAQGL